MTFDDVETRDLVRRAIAGATPAPSAGFAKRTLAATSWPRSGLARPVGRRRLGRPLGLVAALTVVAVAATAMAYPPAREAISRLPGGGVLRALYGDGAQGQQQPPLAEATSNGYTIRVTSGYDDGTTVTLAFAVTPTDRPASRSDIGWAGGPIATDSTGHQMDSSFTPVREALSSDVAFSRPPGGAPAGTPITVRVTGINLLHDSFLGRDRSVSGQWTLRVTIRPSSLTRSLPVPVSGPLGGGTVTFDEVRANNAYLYLRYTLDGVAPPPGLPTGKGYSPNIAVYGPDGGRIKLLSWGSVGNSAATFTWKGQLAQSAGSYRVVFIADRGGPPLERTIAVPNGRSGTIPAVS
jgi:hypothetical protein